MNLNLVVSHSALSIKWTNLNLQGTLIGFRLVKKGLDNAVDDGCEGEKSFGNLKGESTGVTLVRRYLRERALIGNCFGMS